MALIKCSECGASVSDKAQACVKCGAPIVSSSALEAGAGQAATAAPAKGAGWAMKALTWVVGALVLMSCIVKVSKPGSEPSFDDLDALHLCQRAIGMLSRDPEKADVPYIRAQISGETAKFVWGPLTKMARLRNGLGLEVATTAECQVNLATKKITSLMIDGNAVP